MDAKQTAPVVTPNQAAKEETKPTVAPTTPAAK